MGKITKGVRRALAYCHCTGDLPKHIHLSTWAMAYRMVERDANGNYKLNAEALAAIEDEPFYLAHRLLTARGFEAVRFQRSTSHSVKYRGPELAEAYAYRSGGVDIQPYREAPPYNEGRESLTAEDVKAALA